MSLYLVDKYCYQEVGFNFRARGGSFPPHTPVEEEGYRPLARRVLTGWVHRWRIASAERRRSQLLALIAMKEPKRPHTH